jgi:hypothetical protein
MVHKQLHSIAWNIYRLNLKSAYSLITKDILFKDVFYLIHNSRIMQNTHRDLMKTIPTGFAHVFLYR